MNATSHPTCQKWQLLTPNRPDTSPSVCRLMKMWNRPWTVPPLQCGSFCRTSVQAGLAPSIPPAVCFAVLEACQGGSVSGCTSAAESSWPWTGQTGCTGLMLPFTALLEEGCQPGLTGLSTDTVQHGKTAKAKLDSLKFILSQKVPVT